MRKIVKATLHNKMSPAQYEVLLGLWNVDELGKINEWVTDDRLNLEAAENDPKQNTSNTITGEDAGHIARDHNVETQRVIQYELQSDE